jgi:hypothetical protein
MVEHKLHHPNFKGLSLDYAVRKKWASGSSMVVDVPLHHPKFKGLTPVDATKKNWESLVVEH